MTDGVSRTQVALGVLLWAVQIIAVLGLGGNGDSENYLTLGSNKLLKASKTKRCEVGAKWDKRKRKCTPCDKNHFCPGGNEWEPGRQHECPPEALCTGFSYHCKLGFEGGHTITKRHGKGCKCPDGNYKLPGRNNGIGLSDALNHRSSGTEVDWLLNWGRNCAENPEYKDLSFEQQKFCKNHLKLASDVEEKIRTSYGMCFPCPPGTICKSHGLNKFVPVCEKPGHSEWDQNLMGGLGACSPCPRNYFSKHGGFDSCKPCTEGLTSEPGSATCKLGDKLDSVSSSVESNKKLIHTMKKTVELLSISSGDLSVQRAQAEAEVVQRAIEIQTTKRADHSCMSEPKLVVFPAVEIKVMEVKKLTCLMTNRDRLIGAFCNFREEFAPILEKRGVKKEAKAFWPNICCSSENEKCGDEQTPQEATVPFAGSAQGGELSQSSLFDEIHRTIKKNGYLHQGMLDILAEVDGVDTAKIVRKLNKYIFHRRDLCGAREFDMPRPPGQDGKRMCQLFLPYKQVFGALKNDFERLFLEKDNEAAKNLSFLEAPPEGIKKHTFNHDRNIRHAMKVESYKTCKITMRSEKEYRKMEKIFCYNDHIDLMNSDVKTIAMRRVEHGFNIKGNKEKTLELIANRARFSVSDVCSPIPMLNADGISMQKIRTDPFKDEKKWVFLMNLDSESKKGYLQSELSQCKTTNYLPTSNVNVAMYIDKEGCCAETRDYSRCMLSGCLPRPLRDEWTNGQMAFRLAVRGGDFDWTKSEYVLPGTKFTSPICMNHLEKGRAVNLGNVKNAVCTKKGESLLETSALQTISAPIPHTGISYVSGQCANLQAADVFQGVTGSTDDFDFSCETSPKLCACLVDVSENSKTVKFESTSPSETLTLKGNGGVVSYEFGSGIRRRRRLVQEGAGGGC